MTRLLSGWSAARAQFVEVRVQGVKVWDLELKV